MTISLFSLVKEIFYKRHDRAMIAFVIMIMVFIFSPIVMSLIMPNNYEQFKKISDKILNKNNTKDIQASIQNKETLKKINKEAYYVFWSQRYETSYEIILAVAIAFCIINCAIFENKITSYKTFKDVFNGF
jgi:short subunit fatty acids transporter